MDISNFEHDNNNMCDALRDLVPFEQFKKREKHPWRSAKLTLVRGCFSRFLNCTNGTKSRNAPHINLRGNPKLKISGKHLTGAQLRDLD